MVCSSQAESAQEGPCGLRPVLMDFGLARDSLGPQRLTQTGVIMGTPHYMAPEQARGQARHLDRRADVYSLGAMLYEMLTGRPPFDAEHEVDLLLAVLNQDPPPPRKLEPSVPADLEVIAQKCLRKEPEQRYESALALAEDLQRYLRSEPILARPASLAYRARRLAVRHRGLFAVAVVLLLALCGVLGVSLRAKEKERLAAVRADERQRLAAEVGQTLTKMNLFLRIAYSLPPHSLFHERGLVREHLRKLELQRAVADPFLHGTLERAIGQGHLALCDHPAAVKHLLSALELGEATADVHLALGQALGRLYEQRAAAVLRNTDAEPAKHELVRLRQEFLVRARKELGLGQGTGLMSPAYVRALLHFYSDEPEREYDAALAEARQAQTEAPWLIEPIDLELKIITSRYIDGTRRGRPATPAESKAVHDAIERAIGIARSYPEFYASFTDFSIARARDAFLTRGSASGTDDIFAEALPYARTATLLQPDSGAAYDQLADLYAHWAYSLAWRKSDPQSALTAGLAASEAALRILPERSRPYMARSKLRMAQMIYLDHAGEDSQAVTEQALADAQQAARIEPENGDIQNLLSVSLNALLQLKRWKGISTEREAEELISANQRAMALHPERPLPINNLANMYIDLAQDRIDRGLDPTQQIEKARALVKQLASQHPGYLLGQVCVLLLESVETKQLLASGQDASARARSYLRMAEEALKPHPDYVFFQEQVADAHALLLDALARHPDPASPPPFDQAIAAVEAFAKGSLGSAKAQAFGADFLLRKAAWLKEVQQSPEPVLATLFAELYQVKLQKGVAQTRVLALRARGARLSAEWLMSKGRPGPALASVEAGLADCALAGTSGAAGNHLIRAETGALLTLQAQLVKSAAERARLAARAAAVLRPLLEARPPLKGELGRYLKAAQELSAQG